MVNIQRSGISIRERAQLENMRAQEARNAANIEYLSMMTGVDLFEDEALQEDEQYESL